MENRKINEEQQRQKKQRVDIYSVKEIKSFEKLQDKNLKKQHEEKIKKKKEITDKQHLIQIGAVNEYIFSILLKAKS